jgi:hypothetical protein
VETLEQYGSVAMLLEAVMEVRCRCSNFNDPSWCPGSLQLLVPCGPGTPAYKLQRTATQRAGHAFVHRHIACSAGSHLPAREGSDAAMCPVASDPASQLGRAPALPHVPHLRTLPPDSGGLRRCHVSLSFRPHLSTREGSGAVTRPTAPDLAPSCDRAPALPRVPWHSAGCGL